MNNKQVCDFGLSTVKENETEKLQDTDSVPGTPLWMVCVLVVVCLLTVC